METYFNYLPSVIEHKKWGLWALNAGFAQVNQKEEYPPTGHPSQYSFNLKTGRVLQEYQLIYITAGQGTFESASYGPTLVKEGTLILIFPGEKHSYRPCPSRGWSEYWIGFSGKVMDDLVEDKIFTPEEPCLHLGFNEPAFKLFKGIVEKTNDGNPKEKTQVSGALLHLLGCIDSIKSMTSTQEQGKEELLIDKAKAMLHANTMNQFSAKQVATELSLGYSHFRKMFKSVTGLSPGQYYINLKIEAAKEFLCNGNLPLKEVAYKLRFESYYYFSTLFKQKTGYTPLDYRNNSRAGI